MTDILLDYETRIRGRDDTIYGVRACGRQRTDGLWEGWLEFLPPGGAEPLRTARETTQPNRDDLIYWATGLTDAYMDGALLRRQTQPARPDAPQAPAPPPGPGPAPAPATSGSPAASGGSAAPRAPTPPRAPSAPTAVLDPFHVYAEGDDILRGQLRALSGGQLRNIIRAYDMPLANSASLDRLTDAELVGIIMAAVAKNS